MKQQRLNGKCSLNHGRNTAAIGLINLINNLARYEQILRLNPLPQATV